MNLRRYSNSRYRKSHNRLNKRRSSSKSVRAKSFPWRTFVKAMKSNRLRKAHVKVRKRVRLQVNKVLKNKKKKKRMKWRRRRAVSKASN